LGEINRTEPSFHDAASALELFRRPKVSPPITRIVQPKELFLMMKTKLLIGVLAVAGLVASPLAAEAKSYKHSKHHSSTTTGANMKSDRGNSANNPASNPSSQGNVGPGTNNNNGPASGGR
jgi:hypothetical protein